MSTLGRKVWCRNPQASAEWASSRPWTSATTFAWSYWQAASLSLGPTLGKCFPAGSGVTLCWLGVLRLRAPNKPKSNLKHSSNKVDEDKPWRRSCSFPSGSWLWLDISFADFCCLIFFSPWLLFFFFQSVLGRWRKLVQATLLATTHPCYSTVKGMGKLVGLHSLHQMSEMLLNGRLVNHFRFHLSYHVHLHKGNYLYGTLICLYSLWEKSWFNRNETSDHPEGVIILQCHLALQPSPRWEDAPQVVLAS